MLLIRKNIAFRVMIIAQFFNNLGSSLFTIIFLVYAATLPYAKVAVTLVALVTFLPNLLSILLGNLADKTHNHLHAWSIVRLTQAILFLMISGLLLDNANNLTTFCALLVLIVANDALGIYSNLLMKPISRFILPQSDMQEAMSFEQAIGITVTMIGGFFGVSLLELLHHDYTVIALINSVTFMISWLIMVTHHKYFSNAQQEITTTHINRSQTTLFADFKATFISVYADHLFFQLILLAASVNFVTTSLSGLFNLTLLQTHSLTIGSFGMTIAIFGTVETFTMLLGSFVTHDIFQHLTTKQLIGLTCGLLALMGLVPTIWPSSIPWLILLTCISYIAAKINPRIGAIMMKRVPGNQLASVGGLINTLVLAIAPLGQLLFLGLANIFSPSVAWLTMSLFLLLIITYTVYTRKCDLERVEN